MTDTRMMSVSRLSRLPSATRRFLGGSAALGLAMFLTPSLAHAQNFEDAVAGEVDAGQMSLLQVNHYLTEGDQYAEAGDLARAFTNYREAFEKLPKGDAGNAFRDTANQRYADATVSFAEELVSKNRQKEARMIIEEVLEEGRVTDHAGAKAMMTRLDDPEWINPAATPRHQAKVSEVTKLLGQANTLLEMGEFDEATNMFSEVINIDEYNSAARDGLVKAAQISRSYRDASYDKTRAELLQDLDAKWVYNNPDASKTSMRPKNTPDLGSMADTPQSESIARRMTSITIPEINLNGMTIETAVRYLEQISRENDPTGEGINFVLSQSTSIDQTRPITMNLKSVPLLVLVQYVTEFVGAKFRIDQYAVQIVPAEDADNSMISRPFSVRPDFFSGGATDGGGGGEDDPFGGGGGRVSVLSEQDFLVQNGVSFPEGASAQYLPQSNKLLVRNTQSNLDLIDSLVLSSADEAPKQVVVKVTIIDIRQENLEEIGFDWLLGDFRVQSGNEVLAGGGNLVPPVEGTNAQAGFGSPASDFAFTDPETGQVFGGQRVTDGLRSGPSALPADGLDRVIGIDRETALSTNLSSGLFSVSGQMTDPQFQAVLRGVNQHKATDVVTAPFVTVKPGHRARIESGIEFIYPVEFDPPELPQEVNTLAGGGVFPVTPAHPTTFQMRQLGFSLEVEPVISADGKMVDMTLAPEFVEFQGFVNYGSPITAAGTDLLGNPTNILVTDNQILQPVFSTIREAVDATVYDGSTLVIGGLTDDRRDTVSDKVPIIGDLPVIGRLFRSNIDRTRSRAIVIFVSVKVIDANGARVNNRSLSPPADPEFGFASP
ncbi:MAG: general secretion pathway protein D [Verrucomicrobiales bacterium]|jgi:general secretion pathway protein D